MYQVRPRFTSGLKLAVFTTYRMTITMIMQMAKAVPSIEITLNSLFSPIILNACLMYCFIINFCIINYLLPD